MEIKCSITLLKIVINNNVQLDNLQDVLTDMSYNDENGYGFQDIVKNERNDLLGILIKRTPVFITIFDSQTKRIEKVESYVFNEIDFYLDFTNLIAEVFSNQTDINKYRSITKNHLSDYFQLIDIETLIYKFLPKLFSFEKRLEVNKLIIKNFKYSDNVIGKYEATIYDSSITWELLNQYEAEVIKCYFSFPIDDNILAYISIDNYGRLSIDVEEAYYQKTINIIKSIIQKL